MRGIRNKFPAGSVCALRGSGRPGIRGHCNEIARMYVDMWTLVPTFASPASSASPRIPAIGDETGVMW